MMHAEVWTDGSVAPSNPGIVGSWAFVVSMLGRKRVFSGVEVGSEEEKIGNGRMEIMAALEALKFFTTPTEITVYSDAQYVVKCMTDDWISGWNRRGWKTSAKKDVAHRDLWEEMERMSALHRVSFVHTKGHADDEENNRAHDAAKKSAREAYEEIVSNSGTTADPHLPRDEQKRPVKLLHEGLEGFHTPEGNSSDSRGSEAGPSVGDEDSPGRRVVRGGVAVELHLPRPSLEEVERLLKDAPDPPMPPVSAPVPKWCVFERSKKGEARMRVMCLDAQREEDGGEAYHKRVADDMVKLAWKGGGKVQVSGEPRFFAGTASPPRSSKGEEKS